MFRATLRKYLIGFTVVSLAANVTLWYAWRKAEVEQDVIIEQVQREAAEAANERWAERVAREEEAATAARVRAEAAEQDLANYITESQNDETPEFLEWKDTPLPSSVVSRLRGLDANGQ